MPDYTVQDTQTGKTITFQWSGDKPPTDSDMEQVFAQARQTPETAAPATAAAPAQEPEKPGIGQQLWNAFKETGPQNVYTRENLPVIGGVVAGALTGGMGAVPLIAASALGGAAGEGARQVTTGESPDLSKMAGQGALQGAMAAGGEVIGKAVDVAAPWLKTAAQKGVAQALGATKEWAKSEAGKLAPEMLERGVSGTRQQMFDQAVSQSNAVGRKLGATYQAAAAEGKTVPGLVIRGDLDFAKEALMVKNAKGDLTAIPGTERVIRKLDRIGDWVETLGDDIPVDTAHRIKTAWDKVVAKAGLYGPKATATATDSADAWALREATGTFRKLLNDVNPDISALNKEYAFWKGLKDVLKETQKRTQSQAGGLHAAIAGSAATPAGALIAGLSGGGPTEMMAAALGSGWAAKTLTRMLQSPYWRTTVSAPLKNRLSEALASGSTDVVVSTTQRILQTLPATARMEIQGAQMPVRAALPVAAQDDTEAPPVGAGPR